MRFHVLTLFPEMIEGIVNTSITGRAIKNGYMSVDTVNIRDYSTKKTMRVDDYPYGGGAGMVMEAEPVFRAVSAIEDKIGRKPRVVYLTPQAEVLNQTKVEELAVEEDLVLLCGHYEGIDDRVLQEVVTDYVSIGDYVLTGGELGAAVLIDAVSRFVPGVLSNEESSQFESMQDNLLEYPQYTRPEEWHGVRVPPVLLSGDHTKIEAWRYEQSVLRTQERRPDLLRNSYRVLCVTYGDEGDETDALVMSLTETITRYGEYQDYARRKLQKTRRALGANELLILGVPAGITDPEKDVDAAVRFRNLRGTASPAVLVFSPRAGEEVRKSIRDCLTKNGFVIIGVYEAEETGVEKIREIGLEIRKKALHFHDR
uniref:tRNA (guanosine(37)-N1)-methyltransferase TrmD n=1 Tax=Eubacterium cellulosolvens TaxID=29322 RepID=UPI000487BFD8